MDETKLEDMIGKAYEAMNKKQFNKALTFFNMAIKELNELTRDEYYQKRLDEIILMATNCKIEIRAGLLEQVKTFIEHEKIPLILEHYELIIELTHEIGDIENLEKYKQVYAKYNQIYNEKETNAISDLINEANTLKNQGKFEKAISIYKEALTKAQIIKNEGLIVSLEDQLDLIPAIKRKEQRKRTIEMAQKAVDDEKFLLAISLYKLAAKYSAELGEPEKEREFQDEIKKIEKFKDKLEKQRRKEDTKIAGILEKAEQNVDQGNFFEAIKLYYKVKKLRNSDSISEEFSSNIDYVLVQYFIDIFEKNRIPDNFQEVIKVLEEISSDEEILSLDEVYQRVVKRALIPKEEISAILYLLHKIRVLF